MYNRSFIAVAKVAQENVTVDDPELADLLLRLQDIKLPAIRGARVSCAVCLDYAYQPVALQCGHLFCSVCVCALKRSSVGKMRCPLCRLESFYEQQIRIYEESPYKYIDYQYKRLTAVIEAENKTIALINGFSSLYTQYCQAKSALDRAILEAQMRIDKLNVELERRECAIREKRAKCELLKQTLDGLREQTCQ